MVLSQNEVCLATTLFLIFLLQYFRVLQQRTEKKCDDKLISMSDYTIMVENITNADGIEENDLKNVLEEKWNQIVQEGTKIRTKVNILQNDEYIHKILQKKFQIQKINHAFYIKEFIELERKKNKIKKKKRRKIWELKQKLLKLKINNEKVENFSKKYFQFASFVHKEEEEETINKDKIEDELGKMLNSKKPKKITKILSKIHKIKEVCDTIDDKMEKMVFQKKSPVSFVTLNYQERNLII